MIKWNKKRHLGLMARIVKRCQENPPASGEIPFAYCQRIVEGMEMEGEGKERELAYLVWLATLINLTGEVGWEVEAES